MKFRWNISSLPNILDDTLIPKNTNIVFFIYGLHRSSEFFPEPEKFKPERFQNFKSAFPYAYIPFSAGSRNCIGAYWTPFSSIIIVIFTGQRFAMLETKSIISKIVRHFEIKPTLPRHELKLSVETVLKSVNGIKVTLKKRNWCSWFLFDCSNCYLYLYSSYV